jgi:DtxR family Mn-dependent transcriptional regulator
MANQKIDFEGEDVTESEAMYLISVARLLEQGVEEPVPLAPLAEALSVLPASANQMIHKLSESGLVEYFPYKGVALTPPGRQIAMQILRCRRLWEVFLVNCLKLSLVDAGKMACDLEHITPPGAADRLSAFLDHPLFSPQGKPIPRIEGALIFETVQPLIGLAAGAKGRVAQVDADPVTQAFFQSEGLVPGQEVLVQAVGRDGAVLLEVRDHPVHLASGLAAKVMVTTDS